jgi:hypothetical protein
MDEASEKGSTGRWRTSDGSTADAGKLGNVQTIFTDFYRYTISIWMAAFASRRTLPAVVSRCSQRLKQGIILILVSELAI